MISSIVLLFVALGITVASTAYGFGSTLPILLGVSLVVLTLSGLMGMIGRRAPEAVVDWSEDD